MANVTFRKVSKIYKNGTVAVSRLDLEIGDGEFMVLVGPSGCGKTTVLRLVAGLEAITEGELFIGERKVNSLGPKQRDVAMVFQNYALYPHMTVYENIAFPLRARHMSRREVRDRVERVAKLLGLGEYLDRRPRHLSGGERQRVAMGRALVRQPQVFLMDEPLSNLDASLRVEMRAEITKLQRELGVTTLYVTHDQVEAMTMGDRIAVMRNGVLQQVGEPQVLYDRPANIFVAGFIGSPPMNLVRARVEARDGRVVLAIGVQYVDLPSAFLADHPEVAARIGKEIVVGIRPENVLDSQVAAPDHPRVAGHVEFVETLGARRHVHLRLPGCSGASDDSRDTALGTQLAAVPRFESAQGDGGVRMIACFDTDTGARLGTRCAVALPLQNLHFFDAESGLALRGPESDA